MGKTFEELGIDEAQYRAFEARLDIRIFDFIDQINREAVEQRLVTRFVMVRLTNPGEVVTDTVPEMTVYLNSRWEGRIKVSSSGIHRQEACCRCEKERQKVLALECLCGLLQRE